MDVREREREKEGEYLLVRQMPRLLDLKLVVKQKKAFRHQREIPTCSAENQISSGLR